MGDNKLPRMGFWLEYCRSLAQLLEGLEVSDPTGLLSPEQAFDTWKSWTTQVRDQEKTIYLVGNGASASMASHFAADLAKNGHLHTQVFSDLSLLTAISNDISFEDVFAVPLQRRGKPADMLISISSSGRSPNILKVAKLALELGLRLVTLTGFAPDNPLRQLGHLNFYVKADSYGAAETCHAAVLHHWMDLVDQTRRAS